MSVVRADGVALNLLWFIPGVQAHCRVVRGKWIVLNDHLMPSHLLQHKTAGMDGNIFMIGSRTLYWSLKIIAVITKIL